MVMQATIRKLVERPPFQGVVLALIFLNAALFGLETLPPIASRFGPEILTIDRIIISLFVFELLLRICASSAAYFRSGWNIIDFLIVITSLFAASSGFAAIRAFRVLRVLRVVIVLIVYIFAVIGANLYGVDHPQICGDVFAAMYTLFQVMTLEGWADIASEVAITHPRSWIFFLAFVPIATLTMLNLFVAIVVKTVEDEEDPKFEMLKAQNEQILAELAALKNRIGKP